MLLTDVFISEIRKLQERQHSSFCSECWTVQIYNLRVFLNHPQNDKESKQFPIDVSVSICKRSFQEFIAMKRSWNVKLSGFPKNALMTCLVK